MSCWETLADYGLRSLGIGERLLPRDNFTVCQQVVLIGSGMIWNIYFGVLALSLGFFLSITVALGKFSENRLLRKPAELFVFVFRGSPLFIQFFLAYEAFVLLPKAGMDINLGFVEITVKVFSWRILAALKQRVALNFFGDEFGQFDIGKLQQLDRLLQLRRHHQGLPLAHV